MEEQEAPAAGLSSGFSLDDICILPRKTVQPKMVLGPVGDRYEQEADRVARQVVETISSSDRESVQRQEDLEDEDELDLEEGEELRRKVAGIAPAGGADVGPDLESAIRRARSGGQPLSRGVRRPMERAFGADFGGVRVHADGEADRLSRSLRARAFTTGQDIFLRRGEYRPGSSEGQRLLAHELTHVVQQRDGRVRSAAGLVSQSVSSDQKIDKNSRVTGQRHQFQSTRIVQRNNIVPQVIQLTLAGDYVNNNVHVTKTHDNVFDKFMEFLHDNNFQYKSSGPRVNILEGQSPAYCGLLARALNQLFVEVGLAQKDSKYTGYIHVDIDNDFAQQNHQGNCVNVSGNTVRAFYF